MPREVSRYEAEDGTLFKVRRECEEYEKKDMLVKEIAKLVKTGFSFNDETTAKMVNLILTQYIIVKRASPPNSAEQ